MTHHDLVMEARVLVVAVLTEDVPTTVAFFINRSKLRGRPLPTVIADWVVGWHTTSRTMMDWLIKLSTLTCQYRLKKTFMTRACVKQMGTASMPEVAATPYTESTPLLRLGRLEGRYASPGVLHPGG